MAFSRDGRTVVAAEHLNAALRLYEVGTGKELTTCVLAPEPANALMRLAVSPDGKLLAVSMDDRVTLLRMDRLLGRKAGR